MRCSEEFSRAAMDDLEGLKINWDEGPDVSGGEQRVHSPDGGWQNGSDRPERCFDVLQEAPVPGPRPRRQDEATTAR